MSIHHENIWSLCFLNYFSIHYFKKNMFQKESNKSRKLAKDANNNLIKTTLILKQNYCLYVLLKFFLVLVKKMNDRYHICHPVDIFRWILLLIFKLSYNSSISYQKMNGFCKNVMKKLQESQDWNNGVFLILDAEIVILANFLVTKNQSIRL